MSPEDQVDDRREIGGARLLARRSHLAGGHLLPPLGGRRGVYFTHKEKNIITIKDIG